MHWWQVALGVATGLLAVWLLLVAALALQARRTGRRVALRDALRMLPDVVRLMRRLAGDPALPRSTRVWLWLLLAYVVLPIDLVPDIIPVLGYADEVVLIALVLRHVVRRAGPEALDRHWPGTPDGLAVVRSLAGVGEMAPSSRTMATTRARNVGGGCEDGAMSETAAIEPDTKDWTWVLEQPCPECGYAAADVTVDRIPAVIRDNATTWAAVLTLDDAATRPDPTTWSPLEYACHVRDVHRIFDLRVGLMLAEDGPQFPNWDQDETALAERYGEQDPATVSAELLDAAERVAERYESVPPDAWGRRGFRSNGSEFTVESIGLYHLHDLVHHAWDVRGAVARATVAAYDAHAAAYAEGILAADDLTEQQARAFAAVVGDGARVLEIGSGPGRDAAVLESLGLHVRRTDITPAFVDLLRSQGYAADLVDPLVDDLDDPERPGVPYDAVWASASLLHVDRSDLPVLLSRLAAVTRPGGVLALSIKEGDGEKWSTHGFVAAPRRFVYWREPGLRAVLDAAGWDLEAVGHARSARTGEPWLDAVARRRP